MKLPALRWSAVALACLLASGCKDSHEPVKPIASWFTVSFVDY